VQVKVKRGAGATLISSAKSIGSMTLRNAW
jgi:hypothetical protein